MTTIPEPPQIATIQLPESPTLNVLVPLNISIVEPEFSDPTNSLRVFTWEQYASAINSAFSSELEQMVTWSGDTELFDLETETASDETMIEMLRLQQASLSNSSASGFSSVPGQVKDKLLQIEIGARDSLQKSTISFFEQQAQWAIQFIDFAMGAGNKEIRFATDEKKNIIYANMAKVEEIANAIIKTEQSQVKVFESSVQLYEQALASIKTDFISQDIKVENHSLDLSEQIALMKNEGIEFDAKHAENTGIILQNTEAILTAKGCLNDAELEKLKVLETHAILNKYLSQIKKAHTGLVINRSDVEQVVSDLERYEKEGKLIEQESKAIMEKTSSEQQILNQMFKLSMSQVSKVKTEIRAFEEGISSDKIDASITTEAYQQELQNILVGNQNADFEVLGDNDNVISVLVGGLSNTYIMTSSELSAGYSAERSQSSGEYSSKSHQARGESELFKAQAAADANTELQLNHNISG